MNFNIEKEYKCLDSKEQFETLFQSLLQEAFTGVLTWNYPRKECHDKKDK